MPPENSNSEEKSRNRWLSPIPESILLTTNLPFENWTEILGNERMTGALLDRVTHRVHIIEANGDSYRLNDAKKRAKRKRDENP